MLIRENVPEARKLDKKIKIRWFLEKLIFFPPLFALAYVVLYAISYNQTGGFNEIYYVVLGMLSLVGIIGAYALVEIRYRKFVYALREEDFLLQKGVIEKIRYVVPYEKIQNVTVSRDFLDII